MKKWNGNQNRRVEGKSGEKRYLKFYANNQFPLSIQHSNERREIERIINYPYENL